MNDFDFLENHSRFLLTEVLPYELPIIFSNLNFVKYVSDNLDKYQTLNFKEALRYGSVAYKYNVAKDDIHYRCISLMNPVAQTQAVYFIEHYENEMLDKFKSIGQHSLRVPMEIRPTEIDDDLWQKSVESFEKLLEIYNINDDDADEKSPYFESYFINKPFNRIQDFEIKKVLELEREFKHVLKTDIENCFNSIYTHSLSWAYFKSKDLAKAKIGKDIFPNHFDTLMQRSNYNETNGILIGPNLSRIFAEALLCPIDELIVAKLTLESKKSEDFKYFRYVDDIYVFFNEVEYKELYLKIISEELTKFNLKLSEEKTYVEERPFYFKKKWLQDANNILSPIEEEIRLILNGGLLKKPNKNIGTKLFGLIRKAFKDNPTDKATISNYLLSSFIRIMIDYFTKLTDSHYDSLKTEYLSLTSYVFRTILRSATYIVNISTTHRNAQYLFQIMSVIHRNLFFDWDDDILIKAYNEALKHIESIIINNTHKTEISNLVILLTMLDHKLEPETINKMLIKAHDYGDEMFFLLLSIAFYLSKYPLSTEVDKLNKIINSKINTFIKSDYLTAQPAAKQFSLVLRSSCYYFLNAFYHYPLITDANRKLIESLLYQSSSGLNAVVKIVADYKGSFINWGQTIDDTLKVLLSGYEFDDWY